MDPLITRKVENHVVRVLIINTQHHLYIPRHDTLLLVGNQICQKYTNFMSKKLPQIFIDQNFMFRCLKTYIHFKTSDVYIWEKYHSYGAIRDRIY